MDLSRELGSGAVWRRSDRLQLPLLLTLPPWSTQVVEGLSQHPSTSSCVSGKLSSLEFFFKSISGSNSPREAVVVDSDGVFVVQVDNFSLFVLLDYQTFFDFWAVEISLKKFELDT